MTLASEIISRAYREANLVAIAGSPSTNEAAEGLSLLNSLILSTIGDEAGGELSDVNIGGSYDQSSVCSTNVPENVRLVVNQTAARTLTLHPQPYDGQRVAWVDASANFGTYNLTINPNGRKIGGSTSSLVLSTNSDNRQYMYRADTGDWVRLTSLASSDTMPFPTEFDDYFIISLAVRLAPRNSAPIPQESIAALERQQGQIRARYRRPRPPQDWGSLGIMGQYSSGIGSVADFNAGRG